MCNFVVPSTISDLVCTSMFLARHGIPSVLEVPLWSNRRSGTPESLAGAAATMDIRRRRKPIPNPRTQRVQPIDLLIVSTLRSVVRFSAGSPYLMSFTPQKDLDQSLGQNMQHSVQKQAIVWVALLVLRYLSNTASFACFNLFFVMSRTITIRYIIRHV